MLAPCSLQASCWTALSMLRESTRRTVLHAAKEGKILHAPCLSDLSSSFQIWWELMVSTEVWDPKPWNRWCGFYLSSRHMLWSSRGLISAGRVRERWKSTYLPSMKKWWPSWAFFSSSTNGHQKHANKEDREKLSWKMLQGSSGKNEKNDDPETFLEVFERTAIADQWCHKTFNLCLGILLVQKTQTAYWVLSR